MAADLDLEKETTVHTEGYLRFLTLLKWGTIISLAIAAIVVLLIAN